VDAATLIARCRRRARLTQRELAARSGTSAAAICLYERGERLPRVDTLARIVAAAGAMLEMKASWPRARIDLAANGRTLEQLLELADELPRRSSPELSCPVVRDLAVGGIECR
jgi:transcriptional regulator with XRE-family HTH domain